MKMKQNDICFDDLESEFKVFCSEIEPLLSVVYDQCKDLDINELRQQERAIVVQFLGAGLDPQFARYIFKIIDRRLERKRNIQ